VPVLPLIDLLILIAWTCLLWAGFQKAVSLALASSFAVLGLGPLDFVVIAGVSLLFALALAARVWVKANEPRLVRASRATSLGSELLPDYPDPRGQQREQAPERGGGLASPAPGVQDRAASA
jgi:hypothetical protein